MVKKYLVNGNSLTAEEWKSLVNEQLSDCLEFLDCINWDNDNNTKEGYRIYYKLYIEKI